MKTRGDHEERSVRARDVELGYIVVDVDERGRMRGFFNRVHQHYDSARSVRRELATEQPEKKWRIAFVRGWIR